ncbi:Uncharacterised protein [Vibrio cholerae]|nr:Uncharacterised protein [Vibrio cholerae]
MSSFSGSPPAANACKLLLSSSSRASLACLR